MVERSIDARSGTPRSGIEGIALHPLWRAQNAI